MMKGWLSAKLVMGLGTIVLASFGLSYLSEQRMDFSMMTGVSIILWVMITLFLPIAVLLDSLRNEWRRPDVWLHTPQSAYKLFGGKILFAAVIGLAALLLPAAIFSAYVLFFGSPVNDIAAPELVAAVCKFLLSFYFASLMLMLSGLFLAVIYRVIKSYVRRGAFLIWLVVLFVALWIFNLVLNAGWYTKITHFGQLFSGDDALDITIGNFYFLQDSFTLYAGQILVVAVFVCASFVSSVWLFEKKVRL